MRPKVATAAHKTDRLGELVCSNSLKSDLSGSAPHLLKEELRRLGSLLIRIADEVKVPAGHALAVDRDCFAQRLTDEIGREPRIKLMREEVPGSSREWHHDRGQRSSDFRSSLGIGGGVYRR